MPGILRRELELAMILAGWRNVREITSYLLHPWAPRHRKRGSAQSGASP